MNIELLSRHDIGKEAWDAFVASSDECWLWHQYDLQDALSTWKDYIDISFGLIDIDSKSNLTAIMPLHLLLYYSIFSLGGLACINNISKKQKIKLYAHVEDLLRNYAVQHFVSRVDISIASMTPAYSGERCPRVNPLIELGCENTLTQTWVVDLHENKEKLWRNLEGRARTAIRKAINNNVTVREANPDEKDLDIYYNLHVETYNRTGVPPHPRDYFKSIWDNFLARGLSYILFAEQGGEAIAAENFGVFKKRALYWTGAASSKGLEFDANSLLQWTAIQWMIGKGIEWYETGEAFPNVKEGKLKGLNDFKKSFGGELYPFYKGCIGIANELSERSAKEILLNNPDDRIFNKTLIKEWLRATKNLLVPILGKKIVGVIEKIIDSSYNFHKKIKLHFFYIFKYKKRLFFIEPFWTKDEIDIGLGHKEFIKETALSRFTILMKNELNLKDYTIIPTSSGRVGIELALNILKSKYPKKLKVIIPSYGCKGTFDPIVKNNLVPVFVDISDDLVLDETKTIELFSDEILVCVIVNLTGKEVESSKIIQKAREYNIFTIVDNCQNAKRMTNSNKEASFEADIVVYSFGIGKNLMATGGGAIATRIFEDDFQKEISNLNECDIVEAKNRFKYFYTKYRQHKDIDVDPNSIIAGLFNYNKMNPLDAEILCYQLKKIDTIVKNRKKNAQKITTALKFFPSLFHFQSAENHIYTKLSIRMTNKSLVNKFIEFMENCNIELENMYIPLHLRDFAHNYKHKDLHKTELLAPCIINIPVRPNLRKKDINRITKAIYEFGNKYENKSH